MNSPKTKLIFTAVLLKCGDRKSRRARGRLHNQFNSILRIWRNFLENVLVYICQYILAPIKWSVELNWKFILARIKRIWCLLKIPFLKIGWIFLRKVEAKEVVVHATHKQLFSINKMKSWIYDGLTITEMCGMLSDVYWHAPLCVCIWDKSLDKRGEKSGNIKVKSCFKKVEGFKSKNRHAYWLVSTFSFMTFKRLILVPVLYFF